LDTILLPPPTLPVPKVIKKYKNNDKNKKLDKKIHDWIIPNLKNIYKGVKKLKFYLFTRVLGCFFGL